MKNFRVLSMMFVVLMVISSAQAVDDITFGRASGDDYWTTAVRFSDYYIWDPNAAVWEVEGTGGKIISDYAMVATEKQDTGIYTVDFTETADAVVRVYVQYGGAPAVTDDYDGGWMWPYVQVNLKQIDSDPNAVDDLVGMIEFNRYPTTSSKATGLITVYALDGVTPTGTRVRINTNSHYAYTEFKDPVTLAETVTATTWNVAGTIMTNGSATWDTAGVTLVEVGDIVEIVSGTQVEAGEYIVESVDSDTQITLEEGAADGGQPSAVTYYIKQAS